MKKQWLIALGIALGLCAQDALAQEPRFPQFPRDVHGLWWQPTDPGWATAVFDHSTAMSAVLMTYEMDGSATWYYASTLDCYREGSSGLNANCLGPMYKFTGPWFGESTFRPDQVRIEPVGWWDGWWGTPLFASVGPNARRDLFLSTSIVNREVRAQADQPMKIMVIDPVEPWLFYNTGQSGLWVNPNESGWGVGLFQQGQHLTATLFIHGRDRQPRWYVVHLRTNEFVLPWEQDPGRLFEGEVYETRGRPYGQVALEDHRACRVGNASVKFGTEANGPATLQYSIDGVRVTKTIYRIAK
jgi:hypothetical protein